MIQTLPIVGGPHHGGMCSADGYELRMPFLPDDMPQSWTGDGPILDIQEHRYRRERFGVHRGALRLQGEAWVHESIPADSVAAMAMGLLIGTALRTPAHLHT